MIYSTNYSWSLFRIFVFTLPISPLLSAYSLAIAGAYGLFILIKNRLVKFYLLKFWDFIIYYSVLLIGLAYSTNLKVGFRIIETNLSFLVMPLAFVGISFIDLKRIKEVYRYFSLGLLFSSLFSLGNAFYHYSLTKELSFFFYYELTNILYFQPTYFAYYLIFAISLGLYLEFIKTETSFNFFETLLIFYFFFLLLLSGGQTSFVSLLLVFSFFTLRFFNEKKSRTKQILVSITVCMLAIMLLTTYYSKEIIFGLSTDAWNRFILWQSGISASTNILVGTGTGDVSDVLNQYYMSNGLLKYADGNYNSHNQFIHSLFSNGVLGIVSTIFLIARPLYIAYRSQNILSILVFFPFLVYGVTEVFLGRYQGIVLFTFIHLLSLHYARSSKEIIYPQI